MQTKNKENFTEHLNMQPTRDVCHYTCSRLTINNILLSIIIIILLYYLFNK